MVQLTCNIVPANSQFCIHSRTAQLPWSHHALRYMDTPWLQRHHLVYMGFVHCDGTFQMPTHYRTNLSNAHALSYKILDLGTGDFVYLQLASCSLLIDHVMLQLCQVVEMV